MANHIRYYHYTLLNINLSKSAHTIFLLAYMKIKAMIPVTLDGLKIYFIINVSSLQILRNI